MARIELAPLTQWITQAAVRHGDELPAHLMQRLSISRRSASHVLRKLVAMQWLQSLGTPRRPQYIPGALRQVVKRYPIEGLEEDAPWRRDFAPCFARRLFRYATGHQETAGEEALLKNLADGQAAAGYRVRALLSAIAKSDAFRRTALAEGN